VHADQRAALMESYKEYELRAQAAGYRKALEMFPNNGWNLEALATCYVGMGKPADAIAVLEQRLKVGPVEVYPKVSLGMALVTTGDAPRAERELRDAIAMDGQYPLAWLGLGRALDAQKNTAAAEDAYRRAAQLAPGLVDAKLSLADILMRAGRLDEAAGVCASAIDESPEVAGVYLKLAEIQARQKDFAASLASFANARAAAPYTHPPKLLLALQCFSVGDRDHGMQLLTEARAESPDYPMIPLVMGQLARTRDPQAARGYLATAAALPIPENWPDSYRKRFGVLLHSERLHLAEQLQDLTLAREALAEWTKLEPANVKLREMKAQLDAATP
jgi:tetratricopeptide (TPR) repeat protein